MVGSFQPAEHRLMGILQAGQVLCATHCSSFDTATMGSCLADRAQHALFQSNCLMLLTQLLQHCSKIYILAGVVDHVHCAVLRFGVWGTVVAASQLCASTLCTLKNAQFCKRCETSWRMDGCVVHVKYKFVVGRRVLLL